MRNFWDINDIDNALSDIKGCDVIETIRSNGLIGPNRGLLITDACAELFAKPELQKKFPESSMLLGHVYRHMLETGYIVPKE